MFVGSFCLIRLIVKWQATNIIVTGKNHVQPTELWNDCVEIRLIFSFDDSKFQIIYVMNRTNDVWNCCQRWWLINLINFKIQNYIKIRIYKMMLIKFVQEWKFRMMGS